MKPNHKPPKVESFIYSPETKLIALNVLIQKEKRVPIPHKLLLWAEKYYRLCVDFELEIDSSDRKAA
jgi:hypothetical protein